MMSCEVLRAEPTCAGLARLAKRLGKPPRLCDDLPSEASFFKEEALAKPWPSWLHQEARMQELDRKKSAYPFVQDESCLSDLESLLPDAADRWITAQLGVSHVAV